MLMTRINSSLKTFIASPGLRITQFKNEFTKSKLLANSPDIKIIFNEAMITGMKDDYRCAQGLTKCDASIPKFVANISKIAKSFGSGSVDV